jgi:1-acyl-sn-glycerol-3-phosphate acyltransferase
MTLNKTKRFLATGFSFLIFGVCGLIACLFLYSMIFIFNKNHKNRQHIARTANSYMFRWFLNIVTFLGVFKIDAKALKLLEKLKGSIIICNHPTLIDVVIIMAHLKGVQCVVKKGLWNNIILGAAVRSACYIPNDIDPEQFLKNVKKHLANGENILIFPEGTRTEPGQPIKLQRSVGNLAFFANANIQSIFIDCHPVTLTKNSKWYNIPEDASVFQVEIGPLFKVTDYPNDKPRSIRVRHLTANIQKYYNERLGYE